MAFVRPAHQEVIRRHCPDCGKRVAAYITGRGVHVDAGWSVYGECGHDAPLPSAEETANLVTRYSKTGKVVKYHARPRSSSFASPARAGVPQ
jgi:hypothetical protein